MTSLPVHVLPARPVPNSPAPRPFPLGEVVTAPRPAPPVAAPVAPADAGLDLAAARRSLHDGDERATARQRAKGKLLVRERIELLLDPGTFTEIEPFRRHRSQAFGIDANRPHTDGVVTGWGTVDGRTVFVYGHDFRIFGGALGEAHASKIHKLMDLALEAGAPIVSLNDGAGARIQEGVTALAGYGGIFTRTVAASGVIPQISVMLGPCAGGASYAPALTDLVCMVESTSQMFITGPDVVRAVTGEVISQDDLGGAGVHGRVTGVSHLEFADEVSCLEEVRYLLGILPSNNRELPPVRPTADPADRDCDDLESVVPTDPTKPYDMRLVLASIVDDGEYVELQSHWAGNIITAWGHVDGMLVGFVASQPQVLAGVLDIDASVKAARFVQMCDSFNIPIVTLVDVPGFLPGVDQEHGGIIRHGAKLLYAYCNATVPRISLVTRKAYGGAYIVMDSRSVGTDLSLAWPSNEVAVMGAEGAANVIFRKQIAASDDPEGTRETLVREYKESLMHPLHAAEVGVVDDVIEPRETRRVLAQSLRMLRSKEKPLPRRKHGNQPQ